MSKSIQILVLMFGVVSAHAQLKVANVFGDHMVLQRDKPIAIWGWDTPNETVSVHFNGQKYHAVAGSDGKWNLQMPALPAGSGALKLKVSDTDESVEFEDILMGDVWLCSGQSNMEYNLARVENGADEVALASYPSIRHISVPRDFSLTPVKDFKDNEWEVCSPATAGDFTAVGYFFARKLTQELGVPVGLIHSSWGGSHIETWISKEAMLQSELLKEYAEQMPKNETEMQANMKRAMVKFFMKDEHANISDIDETAYLDENYDYSTWPELLAAGGWVWYGPQFYRGNAYAQRYIDIKAENVDKPSEIRLGHSRGEHSFYVNGKLVNKNYYTDEVVLTLPPNTWKAGKNSLLIKLSPNEDDFVKSLGFQGNYDQMNLKIGNQIIPLMNQKWRAMAAWNEPHYFQGWMNSEGTLLYNAMIAPLVGVSLKGALWYQGESNAGRAYDYRTAFPLMIKNWRKEWGEDFPFYWVQLSTYGPFNDSNTGSAWAELREAQDMTLALPNTGQAITIDVGNPYDIHPTNKQDVGLRLALQALHHTYGFNDLVYQGPRFQNLTVKGSNAIVHFNHIGSGLKVTGRFQNVNGFEIAGADQQFYFAKGELVGNTVVLSNKNVKKPVAVRYAWSDSPEEANLFNKEGLPAAPFRTDDWSISTKGTHFMD